MGVGHACQCAFCRFAVVLTRKNLPFPRQGYWPIFYVYGCLSAAFSGWRSAGRLALAAPVCGVLERARYAGGFVATAVHAQASAGLLAWRVVVLRKLARR